MPTVFGYHDVKDTDHWLASAGARGVPRPVGRHEHQHVRRPGEPHAGRRVDGRSSHGRRDGREDTQAAAEAMAYDGVLPETLVILVEA
jgi:hypothetical protein